MAHAGLLLTRSPGNYIGKFPKPDEHSDPLRQHLETIAGTGIPEGYSRFFDLWKEGLAGIPDARAAALKSTSRTLIGHGLASTHQVGLSLHHTYGVPFIPGSALKGVTARYVDAVLGVTDERFRGPRLDAAGRVERDPGEYFRGLFGAAPSETDGSGFEGYVEFHDALVDPASTSLFAADVLTPHQDRYYRNAGADPNEYTSPIPVGFVTALPGLKYHLVLTGPQDWTRLALKCLGCALSEHGIGGKTTSGYGRFDLEWGETEAERAEAVRESERRRENEVRLTAERQHREARLKQILPDLSKLSSSTSLDVDAWKRLLEEAKRFAKAQELAFERVVEVCKPMAHLSRDPWRMACGDDWIELTTALDASWKRPQETEEKPARMWRAPKLGDVKVLLKEGSKPEDVKAHAVTFEEGKLYQDKQYRLELPDSRPAEPNVIVVVGKNQKVIGVKKP